MKKTVCVAKKNCLVCMVAMVLITILFIAVVPIGAKAETNDEIISYEALFEEFTNSDQLTGLAMTLDDYIENMENEYYYETVSTDRYQRVREHTEHLRKIIPIELFKELDTTYYYLGKEYFFYIHTFYDYTEVISSVMILDYDFDYSDEHRTAKIKLKMFSNDYSYFDEDGQDVIIPKRYNSHRFDLLNPELFGVINNKHELNHYDEGYSKYKDPGIIFRQARLNYRGAYQEVNYSWEPVDKYVV